MEDPRRIYIKDDLPVRNAPPALISVDLFDVPHRSLQINNNFTFQALISLKIDIAEEYIRVITSEFEEIHF